MIADTFPVPRAGDIAQFRHGGGIDLATGAAGVLYALARTGAGRFPGYDDWLRKQAVSTETGPACTTVCTVSPTSSMTSAPAV